MSDAEQPPASAVALLDLVGSEWRELQATLRRLHPDQWTQPELEGGRSVKDTLAHLTAWERRMLEWLAASYQGLTPERPAPGMTWDDLDRLNELTFDENRDKPLEQVRQESQALHAKVAEAIGRMSEADLFDGDRFAWRQGDPMWHMIAANTWWHYREHREQIHALLTVGK
jgi:hypothetical protein